MVGAEMINSLLEKSKELDQLKKEEEETLAEINMIHKKLQQSTPETFEILDATLSRLRELYIRAKELSENEVSASNQLVNQLDTLLKMGHPTTQKKKNEASEQKKKRSKSDVDTPRLPSSASMRSQLEQLSSLKGEQVAARVTNDDAEKDEWVVVKVIHYDREAKQFEVIDEDPGEEDKSVQRKYKLSMSRIIPFPKIGDPASAPDFPLGAHVLALYPETTALYRATVVNQRKRKAEDYLLEFDDDEEDDGSLPQRSVPFHKVVPLPDGHRQ